LGIEFIVKGANEQDVQEMKQPSATEQPPARPASGGQSAGANAANQSRPSSGSTTYSNPGWTESDHKVATDRAARDRAMASAKAQGDKKMDQLARSMANLSTGGKSVAPPRPQGQPSRGPVSQPAKKVAGRPSQAVAKGAQKKQPGG
jgi:hypothetical protein